MAYWSVHWNLLSLQHNVSTLLFISPAALSQPHTKTWSMAQSTCTKDTLSYTHLSTQRTLMEQSCLWTAAGCLHVNVCLWWLTFLWYFNIEKGKEPKVFILLTYCFRYFTCPSSSRSAMHGVLSEHKNLQFIHKTWNALSPVTFSTMWTLQPVG